MVTRPSGQQKKNYHRSPAKRRMRNFALSAIELFIKYISFVFSGFWSIFIYFSISIFLSVIFARYYSVRPIYIVLFSVLFLLILRPWKTVGPAARWFRKKLGDLHG